jgi:hypothetical protein
VKVEPWSSSLITLAGVLARDQILVTHAAREAVRAAAVDDDPAAARRAAEQAGACRSLTCRSWTPSNTRTILYALTDVYNIFSHFS